MAELAGQVSSIEIVEGFASLAQDLLRQLGYTKVEIRVGDGSRGWLERAPFDKILVTAAAHMAPAALLDELKSGGRLVMLLGPEEMQRLRVIDKDGDGHLKHSELVAALPSKVMSVFSGCRICTATSHMSSRNMELILRDDLKTMGQRTVAGRFASALHLEQ